MRFDFGSWHSKIAIVFVLSLFAVLPSFAQDKQRVLPTTQLNKEQTALDRYVAAH